MAWWHGFLFIPFVLYIGVIVTAFNERWSAALMMLYMGSLLVIALVSIGWFLFGWGRPNATGTRDLTATT